MVVVERSWPTLDSEDGGPGNVDGEHRVGSRPFAVYAIVPTGTQGLHRFPHAARAAVNERDECHRSRHCTRCTRPQTQSHPRKWPWVRHVWAVGCPRSRLVKFRAADTLDKHAVAALVPLALHPRLSSVSSARNAPSPVRRPARGAQAARRPRHRPALRGERLPAMT